MQKTQSPRLHFPKLLRARQETSSYCGPASLIVLLSHIGVDGLTQERIARTTGKLARVRKDGMTPAELGAAVAKLAPSVQFWIKENATTLTLEKITRKYKYPVGVEWQGIFGKGAGRLKFDDEDDDPGHYSVVTHISRVGKYLLLADPYYSASKDRKINLEVFVKRWWDRNGRKTDRHFIYVITPKSITFPKELGMKKG